MYRKRKRPVPDPFRIFVSMLFLPGMFTACTDDWVEGQQFTVLDDSNFGESPSFVRGGGYEYLIVRNPCGRRYR